MKMDSIQESDHTMTSGEQVTEEKVPRKRSGVFGLVAIFSSLLIILVSLAFSFSDQNKTSSAVDGNINIRIALKAQAFLTSGQRNVCAGVPDFPKLNQSVVTVSQGSWAEVIPLGNGILNDQGQCTYILKILPPSTFVGGNIKIAIKFSFAVFPARTFNLGESAPFASVSLDIPFD
jgi:hypothetical protein